MTVVHDLSVNPDIDTMHAMANRIFASSGQQGLVEVAWTDIKAPHGVNQGKLFPLGELEAAVEYVAALNLHPNRNVYISAGLRREGTYLNARSKDVDVDAICAVFADFDLAGHLDTALARFDEMGIKPNLITFTGKHPFVRGQAWWVLEEPCADLPRHRRIMEAIARAFGGDPTVVNASRIMRLIGSVAWPLKAGRTLEMSGIAEAETRAADYTMDEIESALTKAGAFDAAAGQGQPNNILDFSTAEPVLDLQSLIVSARTQGQWHRHAMLACAHLLGRGTPPDVIVDVLTGPLQQPGYTLMQTRAEIVTMTEGGLRRGFFRDQALPRGEPEPVAPPESETNPFLSMDQLLDMPSPEWMIEGYLSKQGMSALFAPPGAFKSFIAVDMALSVAYGLPWHDVKVMQRKVLYVCAEGQYEFGERLLAWTQHRSDGARTDQFSVEVRPTSMLEIKEVDRLIASIDKWLGEVGLVVIDTLARNFGTGDENSTKDMNAYIAGTARIAAKGVHVLHVHHSGKDGSKGERGSSAFLGALDTSLKLEREPVSDIATLYVKKQKSGPEPKPMRLRFPVVECVHPLSGKIIRCLVPTLAGDEEGILPGAGSRSLTPKMAMILSIIAEGPISLAQLTKRMGGDKSNLRSTLQLLIKKGRISRGDDGLYRAVVDAVF